MAEYYVIKRETCPHCMGDKYVQNPLWGEFIKTFRKVNANTDDAIRRESEWWESRGYYTPFEPKPTYSLLNQPPPEEEPCSECEDEGVIETEVTLHEALMAENIIS